MMDDVCLCLDTDNPAEWAVETSPIARTTHKCCECGDTINPGERYQRVSGVWEGEFDTFKTCFVCVKIREDFFPCGWYYGCIRTEFRENFDFDPFTNEHYNTETGEWEEQ